MILSAEPIPPSIADRAEHPALSGFHEPVRAWFAASFETPTRAQELAWPAIQQGESSLILAPTGSGKTLAAFLAAIDRVMFSPVPDKKERCRVLYLSPLKALAVDVERNLRAPLVGVSRYAERMGADFHLPEVAIRTGDTPMRERAQFARHPSDILITTPESLFLLLTSNAREALRSVRWVIIDEIHAMVGTKRGAHLALSLERLEELCGCPLLRIGLSATVRPVDEAARFLGGFTAAEVLAASSVESRALSPESDDREASLLDTADIELDGSQHPTPEHLNARHGEPRPVTLVDAGKRKELNLTVEVPVEDMAKLGEVIDIPSGPAAQGEVRTSIWPAIHPMILDLIRKHRSTLIFVNSRRLAERLAAALNELAGEEIVRAHHGSIAREQRMLIEDALKAGQLPAMVATSSLELGIDMGAIDLVIQVEAPPSVASGLQRIGRAGHQIGVPSEGVIIPKYRGDLLACATLTARMRSGDVEAIHYPRNPLDVLAQQIVAMVGMEEWHVDDLERVVRRAAPFADLSHGALESVLDMLSGRYPSDEFAELRPRITWDRLGGTLRAREGARKVAVANSGTIPDRGLYGVFLVGGEETRGRGSARVGELDEEMVFETHVGETFVLGASTWRVEEITHDRVLVSPAAGMPGKMPFWHGDSATRPLEFGRAIGALTRKLQEFLTEGGKLSGTPSPLPALGAGPEPGVQYLQERHDLTEGAARNLLQYLRDQLEATGTLPNDRTLVVERYMDEMGDWRICILSPFGGKVHGPWAMAIGALIRERTDLEMDIVWTDDGIVVRLPETDEPPPVEAVIPDPDEVEDLVIRQLAVGGGGVRASGTSSVPTALFASRFREAAARALLLPRKHPGQRAPLWQQRKRAADLLHATAQYGSFPIILEAYRECLRDVFDIPALVQLLREIRRREVRTVAVTTKVPSPFAASLMFNYVTNFMYEGDAPMAERRAQALLIDQSRLRDLLGEVDLRELLDPDALETLELELQHLAPERKARHADALHDLLIRLGDLSREELVARCARPQIQSAIESTPEHPTADMWIAQLERERRAVLLTIGGEPRYVAVEDVGRYRDALGIPPPPGLPAAFLEHVRTPLGDLVARYARTHGPFTVGTLAARLGLGVAPVTTVLQGMEASGRVIQGEFRPGAAGQEWCDNGVLRQLRQRSLARLRHEVEPVEPATLGRFYVDWQGLSTRRRGPDALVEVIEQLQGAAIPASEWEARVLPARIEGYDPHDLDMLTASGAVIWTGVESIGEHDGRVALYLTEHAGLLARRQHPAAPDGPLHRRIRDYLAQRGASFFAQILQACGGGLQQEVIDALWDLVWSGEVTNDTLQPLRAFTAPRRTTKRLTGYGGRGLRTRALFPPEVGGRWSLVSSFLFGSESETERLTARTRQLLERHGVLTREAAHAEGLEGGFSAIYPILKALEDAGKVRRGYFVAGRGATQFALPVALDRLRALREPPEEPIAHVLAATDPANPYGTALPWPGSSELQASGSELGEAEPDLAAPRSKRGTLNSEPSARRRASRSAGAQVILVDGALAGWMGRGERNLIAFLDQVPDRSPREVADVVARGLADQVGRGGRRAVFVKEVNGRPAQESVLGPALLEAGFTFGPHGYMRRL